MAIAQDQIIRVLLACRTRIQSAAWVVVRDTQVAEDIFQSLTVKAISGDAVFERDAALISWAFVTARHTALNWVRDHKTQAVVLDLGTLDLHDTQWAKLGSALDGDRADAMRACVDELPGAARELLEARYYDDRTCG